MREQSLGALLPLPQNLPRRITEVILAGTALTALTSCALLADGKILREYSASSADGACNPVDLADPLAHQDEATACYEAMKKGNITILGFEETEDSVDDMSESTAELLSSATHGLLKLAIEKRQVTDSEQDTFNKGLANNNGCVANEGSSKMASAIVKSQDSSLDNEWVVALHDEYFCRSEGEAFDILGQANQQYGIADVRLTDASIDTPVLAHEILHMLGLGHSGTVVHYDSGSKLSSSDFPPGVPANLNEYLSAGKLVKYGRLDGDIMGEATLITDQINPVHQALLRNPTYFHDTRESLFVPVDNQGTTMSAGDISAGKLAVVQLDQAIEVPGYELSGDTDKTCVFTSSKLVLVPSARKKDSIGLYFQDADNNTISIGSVLDKATGNEGMQQLIIGNQLITLWKSADLSLQITVENL